MASSSIRSGPCKCPSKGSCKKSQTEIEQDTQPEEQPTSRQLNLQQPTSRQLNVQQPTSRQLNVQQPTSQQFNLQQLQQEGQTEDSHETPKVEEIDSGMESLTTSSKDLTPEKPKPGSDDEGDFSDEDLDETVGERLMGLSEMFPDSIRNVTYSVVTGAFNGIKGLYGFGRVATWLFFSSSVILFAPVIFEVERAQMEEMQRSQQKQVLLGPNSAVSGGNTLLPPVPR